MSPDDIFAYLEKIHLAPGDVLVLKIKEEVEERCYRDFALRMRDTLDLHDIDAPIFVIPENASLNVMTIEKLKMEIDGLSGGRRGQ